MYKLHCASSTGGASPRREPPQTGSHLRIITWAGSRHGWHHPVGCDVKDVRVVVVFPYHCEVSLLLLYEK